MTSCLCVFLVAFKSRHRTMELTGSPLLTGCAKQLERWRETMIESWGRGREGGRVRYKEEACTDQARKEKLETRKNRKAWYLIVNRTAQWGKKGTQRYNFEKWHEMKNLRCLVVFLHVCMNNRCNNTAIFSHKMFSPTPEHLSCGIIKCTATQAGWSTPLERNQFNFHNWKPLILIHNQ